MSNSEKVDILFMQLAVVFKMKKKSERKRKYWVSEIFSQTTRKKSI